MNLFVTGIGTNVGKTIVSAILTETMKADYWKPVQSGVVDGKDSDTVKSLITNSKTLIHSESYLLKEPLSPHFAAKLESIHIDIDAICLPETSNHLIIEGAGGLLVPLNQTNYVIDLAKKFDCEIVLVITNYLGCINHTLLSIDYLIKNHFKIHSLVFNGDFENEVKEAILNVLPNTKIIAIPSIQSIRKDTILNISKHI
jgi:dethiobiotin synthetase